MEASLTQKDRELIVARARLALSKRRGQLAYDNLDPEAACQLQIECADLEATLKQMSESL